MLLSFSLIEYDVSFSFELGPDLVIAWVKLAFELGFDLVITQPMIEFKLSLYNLKQFYE